MPTPSIDSPLALLGGLTATQFMARHWQKKPLLVRGAIPGFAALLSREALFEMAGRDGVESRVVEQRGAGWAMRRGPVGRFPPVRRPGWSLLVQGVDLQDDAVARLLARFRFVPDARLDDLMISWASDGGGVGPHFDSYDVFLLQAAGRRRWRIGRQNDLTLRSDTPLKVLANFEPEHEWVLEPGDMLYLPPRWAHDGVAEGECMTYSIGFRAPPRGELARELLARLPDDAAEESAAQTALYRDPTQPAVARPAAVPEGLLAFARDAVERTLGQPGALERALGEYLTEPKPQVWFDARRAPRRLGALVLDRRTRMLHDARHVFINGESYRAGGRDATLMKRLADAREISANETSTASDDARSLLLAWCEAGWLHPVDTAPTKKAKKTKE